MKNPTLAMNTAPKLFRLAPVLALILCSAATAKAQTLIMSGGGGAGPTPVQLAAGSITGAVRNLMTAVSDARRELVTAALAEKKDETAIRARAEALAQAELNLAMGRADEFAKLQAGPNKLAPEQVGALVTLMIDLSSRTAVVLGGFNAGTRGPGQ